MTEWRHGMPWSPVNAFTMVPPAGKPVEKTRGPKTQPKTIQLKGTRALDINGRRLIEPTPRSQFEIGTTNSAKTHKLLKAAI